MRRVIGTHLETIGNDLAEWRNGSASDSSMLEYSVPAEESPEGYPFESGLGQLFLVDFGGPFFFGTLHYPRG